MHAYQAAHAMAANTSMDARAFQRVAVNLLDDNESNTLPMDKAPGDVGKVELVQGNRSPLQLWWWILACGGIPLLLIEWWVYTRRVHA